MESEMHADLFVAIRIFPVLENFPAEQRTLLGIKLIPGTFLARRRQFFHQCVEGLGGRAEVAVPDGGEEMIGRRVVRVGCGGASSGWKNRERQKNSAQHNRSFRHPCSFSE